MKKLFIFLSLILMVGCTTFKPVSTMDNWQLRSEYSELHIKHTELERRMMYEPYRPGMYFPAGSSLLAMPTKPNYVKRLMKIEKRNSEIEDEMARMRKGRMKAKPKLINEKPVNER